MPDQESSLSPDNARLCADCGHLHTPHGCTGDPTPSDLWAGVSVATCDCIPIEDLRPEIDYIDRPRVSFTDGSIAGVVKARKRYPCGSHMADRHYIEPGEHYVANALPPDNPDICNSGWLHLRICLDCCPIKYIDTRPLSSADLVSGPEGSAR